MGARERLLGRRLPPTPVALRVSWTPEADQALREYDVALRAVQMGQARGAVADELQQRLDQAREARAPFVELLFVNAVSPHRYEQLFARHPPTEEQAAAGAQWNPHTLMPELLAECVTLDEGGSMSAEDWAEWIDAPGVATAGEVSALFDACLAANDRSAQVHVGKGSGVTYS